MAWFSAICMRRILSVSSADVPMFSNSQALPNIMTQNFSAFRAGCYLKGRIDYPPVSIKDTSKVLTQLISIPTLDHYPQPV
jgi:hypothetical protein